MTRIALVFGGQSAEHEISILSARNIFSAIDRNKFSVELIGISQDGRWFKLPETAFDNGEVSIESGIPLAIIPGQKSGQIISLLDMQPLAQIEAVFPITHGPYGEDGSLQGIFRHLNLPFVGPDVAASALAMDKDFAKRILKEADLLTAEFACFHYYEKDAIDFFAVANQLGLPVFIKPANMGSSVGVSKAENKAEFEAAIAEAFKYDHKIIVEEAIVGREVECAVLGNASIATTNIGEVVKSEGFYDFDAKYSGKTTSEVQIPAKNIDDQMLAKLISVARSAYQALGCEGLTRVDMFLCEDGRVYINELNTLPGFTDISMYPALWEQAGTSYGDLITALLELAIERGEREKALVKVRG